MNGSRYTTASSLTYYPAHTLSKPPKNAKKPAEYDAVEGDLEGNIDDGTSRLGAESSADKRNQTLLATAEDGTGPTQPQLATTHNMVQTRRKNPAKGEASSAASSSASVASSSTAHDAKRRKVSEGGSAVAIPSPPVKHAMKPPAKPPAKNKEPGARTAEEEELFNSSMASLVAAWVVNRAIGGDVGVESRDIHDLDDPDFMNRHINRGIVLVRDMSKWIAEQVKEIEKKVWDRGSEEHIAALDAIYEKYPIDLNVSGRDNEKDDLKRKKLHLHDRCLEWDNLKHRYKHLKEVSVKLDTITTTTQTSAENPQSATTDGAGVIQGDVSIPGSAPSAPSNIENIENIEDTENTENIEPAQESSKGEVQEGIPTKDTKKKSAQPNQMTALAAHPI
ncbi:hypothetical protein K402DRAFT_462416 [Aulographum hederae CBS 113979]|uniref:Uncharacterized protein n=1 Tax=Aulographum hederae CBS 113979 TaxID=1176131 RepID=A0A6G1H4B0_9PEZI|nr:hypothetical protein K402DRAFT_462416 [Aulographum hederae CBS 113979]